MSAADLDLCQLFLRARKKGYLSVEPAVYFDGLTGHRRQGVPDSTMTQAYHPKDIHQKMYADGYVHWWRVVELKLYVFSECPQTCVHANQQKGAVT